MRWAMKECEEGLWERKEGRRVKDKLTVSG
jgi:hypothetical protein